MVSEKVLLATAMLAGVVELDVGVKVAVRVVPESVRSERVPPEQEISSEEKVLPGSSEKVKIMVAVSPLFKVARLLVMVRVGTLVSKGRESVLPAPRLPAASL